jgi:aspartate kinase
MSFTTAYFASIAGGETILQMADVLARQPGRSVAVVTAIAGVTDLLLESTRLGNYANVYTKLVTLHKNAARRIARDEADRRVLTQDMVDMLDTYSWLGKSLANRGPTRAEAESIAALGGRLAARLTAAALGTRGIRAVALNTSEIIGSDLEGTQAKVKSRLLPLLEQGYLPVIADSTALYREAALLAAAGEADALWLWRDRSGILTADPKWVENPVVIPALSYAELGAMADYGARLPPLDALEPIMARQMPVMLQDINRPDQTSTRVTKLAAGDGVHAILAAERCRVLKVSSSEPGSALNNLLGRALAIFEAPGALRLAVPGTQMTDVLNELESFGTTASPDNGLGLVAVIGSNLSLALGDIRRTLESAGITLTATGVGSSPAALPLLVPEPQVGRTIAALHNLTLN